MGLLNAGTDQNAFWNDVSQIAGSVIPAVLQAVSGDTAQSRDYWQMGGAKPTQFRQNPSQGFAGPGPAGQGLGGQNFGDGAALQHVVEIAASVVPAVIQAVTREYQGSGAQGVGGQGFGGIGVRRPAGRYRRDHRRHPARGVAERRPLRPGSGSDDGIRPTGLGRPRHRAGDAGTRITRLWPRTLSQGYGQGIYGQGFYGQRTQTGDIGTIVSAVLPAVIQAVSGGSPAMGPQHGFGNPLWGNPQWGSPQFGGAGMSGGGFGRILRRIRNGRRGLAPSFTRLVASVVPAVMQAVGEGYRQMGAGGRWEWGSAAA